MRNTLSKKIVHQLATISIGATFTMGSISMVNAETKNAEEIKYQKMEKSFTDITLDDLVSLNINFKSWESNSFGNIGDLYIYESPYSNQIEIFRLKTTTRYSYFPTNKQSNSDWEYLGPKLWGAMGKPGDIYYDTFNTTDGKSFYILKGRLFSSFPKKGESNSDWSYIPYRDANNIVGEVLSSSLLKVHTSINPNTRACNVSISSIIKDNQVTNNIGIGDNTLVSVEIAIIDRDSRKITGSETILAYWKSEGNNNRLSGGTILETIDNNELCIVTNLSFPGFPRVSADIELSNERQTSFSFPNGDIGVGPLSHPLTVSPLLSSIFIARQTEELLSSNIDAIPDNLGDDDYRLVKSGNVKNYSTLMRMVLRGDTGVNGSTLAGYSTDFIRLKTASAINEFLLTSLIDPAIELGLISAELRTMKFSDLLRRYILAELEQDSSYEYGSDNHYKASLALQYSPNISALAQFNHDLLGYMINPDYLLDEYKFVSEEFWKQLESLDDGYIENAHLEGISLFDKNERKYIINKTVDNLGPLGYDNRISRVYIPEGWEARLYTEKYKQGDYYTRSSGHLNSFDVFLKDISSIEILKSPEFMELTGTNGITAKSSKSQEILDDLKLNNKIESVIIPEGWTVRFYEDKGYSGAYYTRSSGTYSDSFLNLISSFLIIEKPTTEDVGDSGGDSGGGSGGWPPGIRPPQIHSIEGEEQVDTSAINTQLNIDPETAFIYAKMTSEYHGLEGVELAQAILETSGELRVDTESSVIYSTKELGGVLGLNLYDIAKLAFDIKDDKELSSAHVQYVQIAFENLMIDSMFPYGSLNNLKATVLNRVAYESLDPALIEKIGSGAEPFILDELSLDADLEHINFEGLTIELVGHVFKLNGINIAGAENSREIFNYLKELDELIQDVEKEYQIVAYEGSEPIKTIPLTDELFAKAQLFKYGLDEKAVKELWKPYLKKGYLKNISDRRITNEHRYKEAELATGAAQDMWSDHFSKVIPISSKYLSTLMEIYLKFSGLEPFIDNGFNDKLRLAYSFEIDEIIESRYFNGIWDNWETTPDSWLVYGENVDYSIKTAGNIFDFMSVSNIELGPKVSFENNQQYDYHNLDIFSAINQGDSDKYCTQYNWIESSTGVTTTKPGALDLERVKWQCNPFYITRNVNSPTVQEAYQYLLSEMMKHQKWGLKTVTTERDILYTILQMFVPVWGTVEAAQKGDKVGTMLGIFGDTMFFLPIAGAGVSSAIKPTMKVVSHLKPKYILGKGASLSVNSTDEIAGAFVQIDRIAAKATAKRVLRSVAKETVAQMNPLDGIGDLAKGTVRSISHKMSSIKGGLNTAPSSPKVYISRDLYLDKIDQGSVDVTTGIGMPSKDRNAFSEVADKENIVIGVRPVDVKSSSLIESGLYGSKSLLVKSKSSDWGPHSGFIPVDQKYAKKSARNNVDKFNQASQNSLDMNVAVESPLSITDARLKELQSFGAVSDLKFDNATGMYKANSTADGIDVDFYYQETSLEGTNGWNIYVKEDGTLKRFNVMGSPESGKAMTADYDLFTIMYNNGDFGVANTLRKPKTHEEWKASVNYDDLSPEFKEIYDSKELYDVKGAGRLGTISDRVTELKDKVNSQLGRGKGMEMVHHGADDANPYTVTADNFPATFFVPKRLLTEDGLGRGMGSIRDYFPVDAEGSVILRNPQEFANFHQVVTNTHFTGPLNSKWMDADQAGEILSRRARLSHLFLNARDQIAKELGAKVDNYRPYYPSNIEK